MTKTALNILYIVVYIYPSQYSNLLLPLPPGNHKIVFYICDSVSVLQISSFLLFFKIPHISNIIYLSFSAWLISLVWWSLDPFIFFQKALFHSLFFYLSNALCFIAQSCPTLCEPIDCSPPGSSVHGILQARTMEWAAMSFSSWVIFHGICMYTTSSLSTPLLMDI